MRRTREFVFAIVLASFVMLTGCVNLEPAPDPTRHFRLSSLATGTTPAPQKETLAVVILPVNVPDYLKRSNIVLRKNQEELVFSEFDRWAEPVENGIARVLAENLTSLFNSRFVRTMDQPGKREGELQLQVNVVEFTATPVGEAELIVESKLFAANGKDILWASRTKLSQPSIADPVDTADSVSALSRALRDYAIQLSKQLQKFR